MVNSELIEKFSDKNAYNVESGTTTISGQHYIVEAGNILVPKVQTTQEDYASSFGIEWREFKWIQADSSLGVPKSRRRLENLIDMPLECLEGKTVLEIGAGGGRFTEILVEVAGTVVCIEPSEAAFLNIASPKDNLLILNEYLEFNPVDPEDIDVVICRGVIQHTKKPMGIIGQLFSSVKKGGWVFFDFYPSRPFETKYWLRHITRRLDGKLLLKICKKIVPVATKLKWRLTDLGLPKWFCDRLIPVLDTRGEEGYQSEGQIIRANILENFDAYSPRYDHPPKTREVQSWIKSKGFEYISPPNLEVNFFRVKK